MFAFDIGLIDTGVGANETMLRFRDDDAAIHFDDAARLSQDQFDEAWVLPPFLSPGSSDRRRLNLAQIDNRAFGFGNDLLRYGHHNGLIDIDGRNADQ